MVERIVESEALECSRREVKQMRYLATKKLQTALERVEDEAVTELEFRVPELTVDEASYLCPPINVWDEGAEYTSDVDALDQDDIKMLDRFVELGLLTKEEQVWIIKYGCGLDYEIIERADFYEALLDFARLAREHAEDMQANTEYEIAISYRPT